MSLINKHKLLTALTALTTIACPLTGQADDSKQKPPAPAQEPTLEEQLPPEIKHKEHSFFTLTFENDLLGNGEDRNYTNGVRLTYFDMGAKIPNILEETVQAIPFLDVNDTSSIYYSFGQNLYTPKDITKTGYQAGDRPYAAFLYGSAGFATLTDNHIDDIELTLGMVGPAALGKQTQKFVHKMVDADTPQGWKHQLHNEPGLIISHQRRWAGVAEADIPKLHFRLIPHVGASVGNIYTHAAAGATLQMTPSRLKWQAPPLRVKPAIPGSGIFLIPPDTFAWSAFAGIESRAVARNIFLDGNSFRSSHSVDKKHLVHDANIGASVSYNRARLTYTLNWRSKEFKGQEDPSLFGALSLSYKF